MVVVFGKDEMQAIVNELTHKNSKQKLPQQTKGYYWKSWK